jgi:hypothetical protein
MARENAMTRVLMAAGTALLALSFSSDAQAQEATPACTAATAIEASVASIANGRTFQNGACVTVSAIAMGEKLYADNVARYRRETVQNDPSSTGAIIGLVGQWGSIGLDAEAMPATVRVVGQVVRCAAPAATTTDGRPASIVAPIDYCGRFRGFALSVTGMSGTVEPADLVRIPEAQAPSGLGSISPFLNIPERARVDQAASRFITAVQRRDRAGLARMLRPSASFPEFGLTRDRQAIAMIINGMFEEGRPFAAISRSGTPARQILAHNLPLWGFDSPELTAYATEAARATQDGIACFTSNPNPRGIWPIDEMDADNRRGRPYACVTIVIRQDGTEEFRVVLANDQAPREP